MFIQFGATGPKERLGWYQVEGGSMAQACTKQEGQACVVCHVGRRSDWHDLDPTASALLTSGRRRREYGSGEVVFAQGSATMACIASPAAQSAFANSMVTVIRCCWSSPIPATPSDTVRSSPAANTRPAPKRWVRP